MQAWNGFWAGLRADLARLNPGQMSVPEFDLDVYSRNFMRVLYPNIPALLFSVFIGIVLWALFGFYWMAVLYVLWVLGSMFFAYFYRKGVWGAVPGVIPDLPARVRSQIDANRFFVSSALPATVRDLVRNAPDELWTTILFSQLYCRVSGTYLVVTLDRRVGLPLGLGTVLYTSADYLLREVPIAQQIDYVFMGPPSVNQSFNANPQAGNIVFVWHEPIADVVIAQAQAGAQGYTIEDPVLGIFRYSM